MTTSSLSIKALLLVLIFWFSDGARDLPELVTEKEAVLEDIIAQLKDLYGQRCTFPCTCTHRYCPTYSKLLPTPCPTSPCPFSGRPLDYNHSSVRLPSEGAPDAVLQTVQCWSSGIDPTLAQHSSPTTLWRYLGTPQGFFRSYPGSDRPSCTDYDPRTRPWYIAASSGPKDVVLIVDVSGSMADFNRLSLAKSAATTVLRTLTINDYVGIVKFSTGAGVVGSPRGLLLPATQANIDSLSGAVDGLSIEGGTNFEDAFRSAFGMLSGSKAQEMTSGCESLILFLTDGEANAGLVGEDLLGAIAGWNSHGNVRIFTYSLGSQASKDLPKAIACANSGVWAQIADGGDLASQMGNYYNYLASSVIERKEAVWTEPYEDASGAGMVVTVAKVFYDDTVAPPVFIGVVGVDLLLSDLLEVTNYESLLQYLVYRSAVCPTLSWTPCSLEFIRSQVVMASGESSQCETNLVCPARDIPQQSCLQKGRDYSFCNVTDSVNVGLIVGCVVGITLGVILLGGVITVSYFKCKGKQPAPT